MKFCYKVKQVSDFTGVSPFFSLKNPFCREIFAADFDFLNLLIYKALQTFMAKFGGMSRKTTVA